MIPLERRSKMDTDKIKALQEDINNAKHIAFLTGAGVSTHSGIPDYRSKGGIYNGVAESPETILSDDTLFNRPQFFYNFVMNNMYFPDAKPNLIAAELFDQALSYMVKPLTLQLWKNQLPQWKSQI